MAERSRQCQRGHKRSRGWLRFESLEERRVMAADISLTNASVLENASGAIIGDVLVDDQASSASKVTVVYQAHIATISGTPLGFNSDARTEIVTGTFTYDRTTGDVSPGDTSRGNYPHLGGGGAFVASVLGTTITGSATPYVQVEDFGGSTSDTFRYIDGPRSIGNQGGVMSVNGTARSDVQLTIAFTDGSGGAFSNDSLPSPFPFAVPPLSQPSPFFFPHTFSIKDAGGTMLLQLDTISMGTSYTLSVSDNRFEISNGQLKLKAGNSLNHETEPTVALDISATETGGPTTTEPFVIAVGDVNEAPTDIQLSRTKVFADIPGAWIAAVAVIDPETANTHTFTLSDARFTVSDGNLYLKSGQSLNRFSEPTVALNITAIDNGSPARSLTESFVLTVEAKPSDWEFAYQWKYQPEDVNADGVVTPLDVALLLSELNAQGSYTLSTAPVGTLPPPFFDVSGDGFVSPLDVALIIAYLNAGEAGEPDSIGAAEQALRDSVFQDLGETSNVGWPWAYWMFDSLLPREHTTDDAES